MCKYFFLKSKIRTAFILHPETLNQTPGTFMFNSQFINYQQPSGGARLQRRQFSAYQAGVMKDLIKTYDCNKK
jgi:hypothetical protein